MERLAPLTGRNPVPSTKPKGCCFEPEKFAAAGLTGEPSHLVRPPRVAECPIQLEARAERVQPDVSEGFVIVEAVVHKVHADSRIVVPGTDHIDPAAWSPSSTTSATTSDSARSSAIPTAPRHPAAPKRLPQSLRSMTPCPTEFGRPGRSRRRSGPGRAAR